MKWNFKNAVPVRLPPLQFSHGDYILDGHDPVYCDPITASLWKQTHWDQCQVAEDFVGTVRLSTVFLGMDYNHTGEGKPILFETMVFGGDMDGRQERYCTWDEALAGHYAFLAEL